jgi:hypothetical protein
VFCGLQVLTFTIDDPAGTGAVAAEGDAPLDWAAAGAAEDTRIAIESASAGCSIRTGDLLNDGTTAHCLAKQARLTR